MSSVLRTISYGIEQMNNDDPQHLELVESLKVENTALRDTIVELKSRLRRETMAEDAVADKGDGAGRLLDFATFAVENLSDGMYLISKDARIVYANDAACLMLGYEKEEIMGMTMMEVNTNLTRDMWDEVWATTKRDKKQTLESKHKTKDGRIIPVEILANYIEFDGTAYSCAFTRDITERRKMERRIRQSEKMEAIGQLAGGIAHDFNNQLAGIVGYADILREELEDRPQLARFAEAIITAAKRSSDLTEQLLAFARQGKYLSTSVDLHHIINEVVRMLERSIDKRIVIKTAFEAGQAVTVGDPSQLENALLNLSINARDAMPDGGELTFWTQNVVLDEDHCARSPYEIATGQYVVVGVNDTGTGMDAETEARIFEPFFTTKAKGKGTGMGLAAVYGIVKNHKGAINVYTEPGRGTEVKLYLPLAGQSVPAPPIVDKSSRRPLVSATILLIEDEETIREVTTAMLARLGCRVLARKNGNEAIELYRESFNEIDVVIIDLVMPELSGKDTFLRMRDINPGIAAVLASGYSLDGEIQAILDAGAKGFIQKPFRSVELAKTLSEILESRGRRR
jgi:PAS domain S-box-containing protein